MLRTAIGASVLATILAAVAAPAADLQVVSTSPPRNLAAAPTTTVSITFDRAVQTSSITANTFRVFGRVTGTATGPIAFSNGNATATLAPSTPFAAGEVVLVNLSHDILAADLMPLRAAGFAYQFRITTQAASLVFEEIETKSNRSPPGTVGTRIYGAMAADLDNDGYADLTTVNEDSADLRVFINKADGTGMFDPFLTPPLPIGVESSPNEPADFNNDGNVDIAVSSTDDGSVWMALGNGDGTYDPAQEVATGSEPHGIAVLDVDGDADLDVANAAHTSDNLWLTLNNGSGVFAPATSFNSGEAGEYALYSGDMNNDGIVDLVVGTRDDQSIIVMLSNGNGTFTPSTPQNAGGQAWKLVTGDVNDDGDLDVAVVNGDSSTAAILLGNGDGTLAAPQVVSPPNHVVGSALGDMDGDGDLDWMVSSFGGQQWTLYTNNGSGVFAQNQQFDAVNNPSCAIIVDLDNDGDLDLALTDEIADLVTLLRNGPSTGPTPTPTGPTPTPTATPPLLLCPATPQACRASTLSGKSLLKIKDRTPDDKDLIIWKWLKGAATTIGEFGDPTSTDAYTLCLYDNGAFVTSATAPAGGTCGSANCWVGDGDRFTYKDKLRDPQGVQKLALRAGGDGDARILFKGKGADLPMPNLASLTGPLDVQIINSTGSVCWGATYSAPFHLNDGVNFKDKSD